MDLCETCIDFIIATGHYQYDFFICDMDFTIKQNLQKAVPN